MLLTLASRGNGGTYWGPFDRNIIESDKARTKIANRFAKLKHNFAFYANFNRDKIGLHCPKEDIRRYWGESIEFDDRISVILNNNASTPERHRPISAWTLIHRFMHCVQVERRYDETLIWACRRDIFRIMTGYGIPLPSVIAYEETFTVYDFSFPYAVLTMRCARERNFHTSLDVVAELLCQYLFTGRIRFNNAEDVIHLTKEMIDLKNVKWPIYGPKLDVKELDSGDVAAIQNILDRTRVSMEKSFDELLDRLVGEVVVF